MRVDRASPAADARPLTPSRRSVMPTIFVIIREQEHVLDVKLLIAVDPPTP